jgi:guanine deaminase
VSDLWPEHERYLDVYHHYGLTGERSVFAHAIHLHHSEWQCLHDTGSAVAFCPTSTCFSAAGCFACPPAGSTGCGWASAPTSARAPPSACCAPWEAYKVGQLQSYRLRASEAFYHATLGGAHALRLDDKIGNFAPGKEADFVVIDPDVTPLQRLRNRRCQDIYEQLLC